MFAKKFAKKSIICASLLCLLLYFGVFTHIFEVDFDSNFHYPYDGPIEDLVQQMRRNITPSIAPINTYNFTYKHTCANKCKGVEGLRLVFLVKSAPEHFKRRQAIRSSWGFERRFSDVEIRTVFLLGMRNSSVLMKQIERESEQFGDLVQASFIDDYYNNTLKTMAGFKWAARLCPNSRFYMFVDDDYYVSTKNLLRFLRNPVGYPDYLKNIRTLAHHYDLDDSVRLYTGFAFRSSPLRHLSSKWYVSLEEYPYDKWPPYVTAGAYVLSREALLDMFYASFYTQHFRFDDIYVALLAFKCKIEPFHCDQFYFDKIDYDPKRFEFVVASHGYGNPSELLNVWSQQKAMGHA